LLEFCIFFFLFIKNNPPNWIWVKGKAKKD
jgi:hypothetical protein